MVVKFSKQIHLERCKTTSITDKGAETEGFLKVSIEYCLKWKCAMPSTRVYKPKTSSAKEKARPFRSPSPSLSPSPSPKRKSARGWPRGASKGKLRDWIPSSDSVEISDQGTDCDLIGYNDAEQDADPVIAGNEETPPEEGDEVSESGEVSDCSVVSTSSGPSYRKRGYPMKWSAPNGLCSDCRKSYRKARRMRKQALKDKIQDNDPSSLTCDQWVLLKKRRPNRLHHMGRGRLGEIQFDQLREESEQGGCSRPHVFLQRNLISCRNALHRAPTRTGKTHSQSKRRKRSKAVTRGPRLAKQRRLHGASLHGDPYLSSDGLDSRGASSGREDSKQEDKNGTSKSLTMELPQPTKTTSKQEVGRKGGFRELLAKLRVDSTIVKESAF